MAEASRIIEVEIGTIRYKLPDSRRDRNLPNISIDADQRAGFIECVIVGEPNANQVLGRIDNPKPDCRCIDRRNAHSFDRDRALDVLAAIAEGRPVAVRGLNLVLKRS
ncbi:hypothetical protein D3C71_931550 [compost metagenome]